MYKCYVSSEHLWQQLHINGVGGYHLIMSLLIQMKDNLYRSEPASGWACTGWTSSAWTYSGPWTTGAWTAGIYSRTWTAEACTARALTAKPWTHYSRDYWGDNYCRRQLYLPLLKMWNKMISVENSSEESRNPLWWQTLLRIMILT